jgi:hypothetical protein
MNYLVEQWWFMIPVIIALSALVAFLPEILDWVFWAFRKR